jgi:predicted CopG family antitoxin
MTTKTPTKVGTIELTEPVLKRINDIRGGVSISDFIADLITEHLKKRSEFHQRSLTRQKLIRERSVV